MKCPNCDVDLTKDTQKVEFQDIDDNYKIVRVTAKWCIKCGYVHGVY